MTQNTFTSAARRQPPAAAESFDHEQWLAYFKDNRAGRQLFTLPARLRLEPALARALTHSLQRFQIGETGDGTHLKQFAATTRDDRYIECIGMFIAEEQEHARLLAGALHALGGELLTWHWSDCAFVAIRRMLGLRTAILTLFVAEVIGQCFYEQVRDSLPDATMSGMFALIVADEVGHIRFHAEYTRCMLRGVSAWKRLAIRFLWTALYTCACAVFVWDHRAALRALGSSPLAFFTRSFAMFQRAGERTLSL